MRQANVRLWLRQETWLAFKAVARQERVPATVLLALMVRNYVRKPWRFDYIPERREPEQ